MKQIALLLLLATYLLLAFTRLHGQARIFGIQRHCPTIVPTDKATQKRLSAFHKNLLRKRERKTSENQALYRIPVVVHVLYYRFRPDQNISEAQITSQINVLNQDFRRQNSDAVNTPSEFSSVAADARIDFF